MASTQTTVAGNAPTKNQGLLQWVSRCARMTQPDRTLGLYVDDEVSLGEAPEQPVATLDLPGESWLRLIAGRLGVGRTPADVTMSGAVSLDDLRRVFPGY